MTRRRTRTWAAWVRAGPDTLLPGPPDPADLRHAALAGAPLVQQADAQASTARAMVWSARSQYWPSLSVSYSNNRQGVGSPNLPFFANYPETFSWRFGASWPILKGSSARRTKISHL